MSEVSTTHKQRKRTWYNHWKFPVVPEITIRPANAHNAAQFGFSWLFFRIWTLDHIDFEVSIVAGTHWGIGFIGIVPYLRWVVAIPMPEKWGLWLGNKTGKKCLAQRMPKSFRGRYH